MLAAHERAAYEWEQYVSISQAAGVREDQFIAIAEHRFDDAEAFTGDERVLPRLEKPYWTREKLPPFCSSMLLNTSQFKSWQML